MGEMRNFSDNGLTCYANVKLDSGEPCFISIAQSGILVKRSRLGLFGPALYKQSDVYKNAMTAKALHYLYPAQKTPAGITTRFSKRLPTRCCTAHRRRRSRTP
jgi:hypothetical protein